MNGGASRRTCAPPSESPRRYPPPAPQPDLRYFPHENSGGELHAGFTLKPCGWLNSGRESGSVSGRDQQPGLSAGITPGHSVLKMRTVIEMDLDGSAGFVAINFFRNKHKTVSRHRRA